MPTVKPYLWKLVPEDGRVGRRRGIIDLACRSTDRMADMDRGMGMDDLAEGIMIAVRPFLLSRGIEVELWTSDTREGLWATVFCGMQVGARLLCTEVTDDAQD